MFFHHAVMKCFHTSYRPTDTTAILWDLVQEAKKLDVKECTTDLRTAIRGYGVQRDFASLKEQTQYILHFLFSRQCMLKNIRVMFSEKHDIESYKYSEALFEMLITCNARMNEMNCFTRKEWEMLRLANYIYFGSY